MKKISISFIVIAILFICFPVNAANNGSGSTQGSGQSTQTAVSQPQQGKTTSPTAGQVSNQNQVKTQNQGEETQLQISTQEKEGVTGNNQDIDNSSKDASPRNDTARENMSNVSQKVEELLIGSEDMKGGIGDQVKIIAQDQKKIQNEIKMQLDKVDGRSGLLKSLMGPDYQVLKNMQKQTEQNQLRIQQLEQFKTQLANEGDLSMVQEAITALTSQNTALQDKIALEEKSSGLFGWLFKMFVK